MQPTFRIDLNNDENVSTLALAGRLDIASAPVLEKQLQDLASAGCRRIVVDLGGLELVVSAGLRVFLAFAKSCRKTGGRVVLCSMRPVVHQVFELAGFTEIFTTFATRDEAVKALRDIAS